MARKSRKNSSQPESTAQIGQMSYVTAIYARLSVENSGKQDEGASLQNQIDVCKEYVAGCPYLRLAEVYADNGKTGTVFDRPAWNRLMDDVRSGKVEAIVVRDLSRFGRDYIEVGNYLEKIFRHWEHASSLSKKTLTTLPAAVPWSPSLCRCKI